MTARASLGKPTGTLDRPIGTTGADARLGHMDQERVIAIGLLTERDLRVLGPTFKRVWPVDDAPAFPDLLRAIDEADEAMRAQHNQAPMPPTA